MIYTDIIYDESIEMEDYVPLSFEMNPKLFVFGSGEEWPFFH